MHRLVASAFIDKPDGCDIVNHLDGDKTNNRVDNLEWTTVSGNAAHAVEAGLRGVRTKMADVEPAPTDGVAVHDFPEYLVTPQGRIYSTVMKRYRKPASVNGGRYLSVVMCGPGGIRKTVKLQRLIADAFVPNPDGKKHIRFKNSDGTDCRAENLEWSTQSEIINHAVRTGAHTRSRRVVQKDRDGNVIKTFRSATDASRETGI